MAGPFEVEEITEIVLNKLIDNGYRFQCWVGRELHPRDYDPRQRTETLIYPSSSCSSLEEVLNKKPDTVVIQKLSEEMTAVLCLDPDPEYKKLLK